MVFYLCFTHCCRLIPFSNLTFKIPPSHQRPSGRLTSHFWPSPNPPTQQKFKGDHAFFVVATSLWKKQPHHIRCTVSITSFKVQLRVHVFLQAFDPCRTATTTWLLSVAAVLAFKLPADFMVRDGCIHDFHWMCFESIWSTNVFLAVLDIYIDKLFEIRVVGHTTMGSLLSRKTQIIK